MIQKQSRFKALSTKILDLIRRTYEKLQDPKVRMRTILYGGAATLVMIFLVAISLPATSNPTFCGQVCHSMKREYETWKRSSHANITCTACHVQIGLAPFFYEKSVEGPLGLFDEFFPGPRPINIESELGFEKMTRDTCERCHNMKTRNVTPSRIFSGKMYGSGNKYHAKHLKKGIPCTMCHNRVVHKDVNKPEILKAAGYSPDSKEANQDYKDGLSMTDGCFRCHAPDPKSRDQELVEKYEAEKAPKECTNCHVKELLPTGHKSNDWRAEHPKPAKKDVKYCLTCHGAKARFNSEGEIYCTRCHAKSFVKKFEK